MVLQEAKGPENQLVVEMPLAARKTADDPALAEIDVTRIPPLAGYNRTRARQHAWTPLVISPKSEPLLARARYGRGQAVAFSSSATPPWAQEWIERRPADYVRFWRQTVLSVLPPPHRTLSPETDYHDGQPVFDFAADKVAGTRSVPATLQYVDGPPACGGKIDSRPITAGPVARGRDRRGAVGDLPGKTPGAFSWSRTYGREFGDPAQGEAVLKALCRETGGGLSAAARQDFSPGREHVSRSFPPAAWLAAAVGCRCVEILLQAARGTAACCGGRGRRRKSRQCCSSQRSPGRAAAMEIQQEEGLGVRAAGSPQALRAALTRCCSHMETA